MYAVKIPYYLLTKHLCSFAKLAKNLICCCWCKRKMPLAHESCKYTTLQLGGWFNNYWWKIWPFSGRFSLHYAGCGRNSLKLLGNCVAVCCVTVVAKCSLLLIVITVFYIFYIRVQNINIILVYCRPKYSWNIFIFKLNYKLQIHLFKDWCSRYLHHLFCMKSILILF